MDYVPDHALTTTELNKLNPPADLGIKPGDLVSTALESTALSIVQHHNLAASLGVPADDDYTAARLGVLNGLVDAYPKIAKSDRDSLDRSVNSGDRNAALYQAESDLIDESLNRKHSQLLSGVNLARADLQPLDVKREDLGRVTPSSASKPVQVASTGRSGGIA